MKNDAGFQPWCKKWPCFSIIFIFSSISLFFFRPLFGGFFFVIFRVFFDVFPHFRSKKLKKKLIFLWFLSRKKKCKKREKSEKKWKKREKLKNGVFRVFEKSRFQGKRDEESWAWIFLDFSNFRCFYDEFFDDLNFGQIFFSLFCCF